RDARRDAPRERATLLLRGGAAIGASEWTGPDSTRPLTEAGRLTASTLTALTSVYEVNSALSATTERSWSTLEPLARSRRLEVDATPMLDEGLPEQNLAVVDAVRGLGAAVCMHESSVRDVISALQQRDGLRVTSPLRVRRGSVWVLTGDERAYRSALYLPLPDADLLGADRATTLATSSAS
ncbi:MAG: hypothetical protein JSS74_00845, partial [Actinobacteria bacterium]|nr:hypothetical protein [Actinomycetota bacterium]